MRSEAIWLESDIVLVTDLEEISNAHSPILTSSLETVVAVVIVLDDVDITQGGLEFIAQSGNALEALVGCRAQIDLVHRALPFAERPSGAREP